MTEAAEVFGILGMVWLILIVAGAAAYKISDYQPKYKKIADCLGAIAILWMAPMIIIPTVFYT